MRTATAILIAALSSGLLGFPATANAEDAASSTPSDGLPKASASAGVPATSKSEPIRIRYRAGRSCPSSREFQRLVFARTSSARLANDDEVARTFEITLRHVAGGVTGSLVIREANGSTVARKVSGSNCREIATVLALASALAIDPYAQLVPAGEEDKVAPEPEPEPDPVNPGDSDTPLRLEDLPPVSDWQGGSISDYDRGGRWRTGIALGARVATALASEAALGGGLWLGTAGQVGGMPRSFGLGVAFLQTGALRVSSAAAEFTLLTVRPQLCPVGLMVGERHTATACVVAEFGMITGRGSNIDYPTTSRRFWSAAEALLRLELELGATWFLGIDGGISFPLSRYRFVFQNPDRTIRDVPSVAPAAGVRLGVRYW